MSHVHEPLPEALSPASASIAYLVASMPRDIRNLPWGRWQSEGILDVDDLALIRDLMCHGIVDAQAHVQGMAVLLVLLCRALRNGEIGYRLDKAVINSDLDMLGIGQEFSDMVAQSTTQGFPSLIGESGTFFPIILENNTPPVAYFQRFHAALARLRKHMQAFDISATPHDDTPNISQSNDHCSSIITDILTTRPIRNAKGELQLNQDQQRALLLTLTRRFTVISGGPGTGKTSLVVSILRAWMRRSPRHSIDRMAIAAPTGRAANRLFESITAQLASIANPSPEDEALATLQTTTLHRLLGFGSQGFRYTKASHLPVDFILIDEVSMVDVQLMTAVLDALPPESTIVVVGDAFQLPSVEPGAVLVSLVSNDEETTSERDNAVFLRTCYRCSPEILSFSARVNAGDMEALSAIAEVQLSTEQLTGDAPALLRSYDGTAREVSQQVAHHYALWYRQHIGTFLQQHAAPFRAYFTPQKSNPSPSPLGAIPRHSELEQCCTKLFSLLQERKLLTFLRHGFAGCESLNDLVQTALGSDASDLQPVLITQNDRHLALYNGDVGFVLRMAGEQCAVFPSLGGYCVYDLRLLPTYELAFATTVHKSQGSEYNEVILLFPEEPSHPLLYREALYTAVTRAKHRVLLVGSDTAISAAIARSKRASVNASLW